MISLFTTVLPFLISLASGYLLVGLLTRQNPRRDFGVNLFLGGGLGLGLSALLTFCGFVLFDRYHRIFVIAIHLITLIALVVLKKMFPAEETSETSAPRRQWDIIGLHVGLLVASLPLWLQYKIYPYGGWDAWQVWNLKAKILFLSGPNWKDIFLPQLWQTSPHYPLLLPLTNVWGWSFQSAPTTLVPFITAWLFTYLTAGLLFSGLLKLTGKKWTVFAPLILLSLPFFGLLATSQYSDILVGYYILAAVFALLAAQQEMRKGYACLAGLFCGLLAFAKPEGMVAALILANLGAVHLLFLKKPQAKSSRVPAFILFVAGLTISLIPCALFQLLYSPGNQTFINGLTDWEQHSNIMRLKMTFAFLGVELISRHWNGAWILAVVGLLIANRRTFQRKALIPSFIFIYLTVIISYYYVNTYFEIVWWLQVTLHRILFSLLPLVLFWTFYSLGDKNKTK